MENIVYPALVHRVGFCQENKTSTFAEVKQQKPHMNSIAFLQLTSSIWMKLSKYDLDDLVIRDNTVQH